MMNSHQPITMPRATTASASGAEQRPPAVGREEALLTGAVGDLAVAAVLGTIGDLLRHDREVEAEQRHQQEASW